MKIRREQGSDVRFFRREKFGLSDSDVHRVTIARVLMEDLFQKGKSPRQLVEERDYQYSLEQKSLQRIISVLQGLSCVVSITPTEDRSMDNAIGRDIRIKLRGRRLKEVFIQAKSSIKHVGIFFERQAAKRGIDQFSLRAQVLKEEKIILLSSSMTDGQIISVFIHELQAIEEHHIHTNSHQVINIGSKKSLNGFHPKSSRASTEPLIKPQDEVAIYTSAMRLKESAVVTEVDLIKEARLDGAELSVELITGERVNVKLVRSNAEAQLYITELAKCLGMSLADLFLLLNEHKLLILSYRKEQDLVERFETELVRLWDDLKKKMNTSN